MTPYQVPMRGMNKAHRRCIAMAMAEGLKENKTLKTCTIDLSSCCNVKADDVEPNGRTIWNMPRRVLTLDEVELILCGEATAEVSAWEKCTEYDGGLHRRFAPCDYLRGFWYYLRGVWCHLRGFGPPSCQKPRTLQAFGTPGGQKP